jgi:UDP-2,4-diacetamido-2,4,6-trideoxy-beta-L-altropyranose hydrolase
MRCLALAEALSDLGVRCRFICRPHAGNMLDEIAARGFDTIALTSLIGYSGTTGSTFSHAHWLATTAERDVQETKDAICANPPAWMVVDHYGIDRSWEVTVHAVGIKILVIDDLADRPHHCDALLDHGLDHDVAEYSPLVPLQTKCLFGPQYALLRSEFAKLRSASLSRRQSPSLSRILISMGGVDKDNATGQVLAAMASNAWAEASEVTVVMGPRAPCLEDVRAQAAAMPGRVEVLVGTSRMAELMYLADLAIGGAGTTSWERCCLGLPSVVLVLADNQKEVAASLARAGAAFVAKTMSDVAAYLARYHSTPSTIGEIAEMSRRAAQITDGRGATKVASFMVSQIGRLSPTTADRYHRADGENELAGDGN